MLSNIVFSSVKQTEDSKVTEGTLEAGPLSIREDPSIITNYQK